MLSCQALIDLSKTSSFPWQIEVRNKFFHTSRSFKEEVRLFGSVWKRTSRLTTEIKSPTHSDLALIILGEKVSQNKPPGDTFLRSWRRHLFRVYSLAMDWMLFNDLCRLTRFFPIYNSGFFFFCFFSKSILLDFRVFFSILQLQPISASPASEAQERDNTLPAAQDRHFTLPTRHSSDIKHTQVRFPPGFCGFFPFLLWLWL